MTDCGRISTISGMMIEVLKKLSLSEKEAKVYLALLEAGPRSLRALAEVTNLNRGTVHNTLKVLATRGLVSFYHQDTKQHFIAESPEVLLREARSQEQKVQQTISEITGILPELSLLYDDATHKPKVRYYEGVKGVRNILDDLLSVMSSQTPKSYVAYSDADLRSSLYECYPEFTDRRIKAGIGVQVIATGPGGRLCGLDERRWIEGARIMHGTYALIYADRTAYITRHKQIPVGILIQNTHIAESQRCVFDALWNYLPVTK